MLLRDFVLHSEAGDTDSTLYLLEKFSPLLKKYARKLDYEDAFSDIRLYFIELLPRIYRKSNLSSDAQIISYIETCIKNAYISLSKVHYSKVSHEVSLDRNSPSQEAAIQYRAAAYDDTSGILVSQLLSTLTPIEKRVIWENIICGFSISEIAQRMECSRQCVNQTKLRGLKKLKKSLTNSLLCTPRSKKIT